MRVGLLQRFILVMIKKSEQMKEKTNSSSIKDVLGYLRLDRCVQLSPQGFISAKLAGSRA